VRTGRPAVPWRDVVRFAVVIPAPLAVAVTATAFGAVGLLAGGFATGGGWAPVVVVALISVVAAGISAINATMSLGSLQLLVYTALASGFVTSLPWHTEIAFLLLGAAWATLATLVQTRTEPGDPDRAAVAEVFSRIADLLEAEQAEQARRELTTALNPAYDRVIRSRSHHSGRVRELSELAGVLNSAAPLVEAAVAVAFAHVPADDDVAAVRALAAALGGDQELPGERPPPLEEGHHARRAVRHGIRLVWNVVGDPEERAGAAAPPAGTDLRTRLHDLADRTLVSADSRAFAVR
jgi:uncharacterized membrane protein YccC